MEPQPDDLRFGRSLSVGDFNGDFMQELVIGIPGASVGGRVNILSGGTWGLVGTSEKWSQDSSGISGQGETGDRFGGGRMSVPIYDPY